MKRIRIHKDIAIRWRITTNGQSVALAGRDLYFYLTDALGNIIPLPFTIADTNRLDSVFYGMNQVTLGDYTMTLIENKGKIGESALDKAMAFSLVALTDEEYGLDDNSVTSETVNLGGNMSIGIQGESAYQIAVRNGFEGTEQDWLVSLKGERGEPGNPGTIAEVVQVSGNNEGKVMSQKAVTKLVDDSINSLGELLGTL